MANEWKVVSLGDVAKVQGGYAFKSKDFTETGIPVVKIKNVRKRDVDLADVARVSQDIAEKASSFLIKSWDVLISMTGSGPNAPASIVGRVARHSGEDDVFLINQRVGRFLIKEEEQLDQRFLYYLFSEDKTQLELLSIATGSANQVNISGKQIESIEVNLPPLPEQKSIAHILGSLDDKIELNRQMNETLEAMAQALFKSWFVDFDPVIDNALAAGKPIPDEFIERAEQRKAIEKKDHSDIQGLFPDEFEFTEEMGWIPKGWAVGSLDNMFELQRGFDLPKTKRTDGIYPLMAASGQDGTHDEYKVKGPGVITGRSGKLGIVSFTNANYWPLNTTLWVKNYNQSNPYHAYFFLQTLDLEKYNSGSAVPSLNRNNVHNLIQILPSNIVLDKFQEVIESSFAKIAENNTGIETLAKLRDTLVPKLMSGELRIPDTL